MSTLAFRGGLLSSPAAVFWVLQPWQVGPVGFHRFMPRISDGATASFERSSFPFIFTKTYDAMEIHERWEQKWKNAFFWQELDLNKTSSPGLSEVGTQISSHVRKFSHYHHHPRLNRSQNIPKKLKKGEGNTSRSCGRGSCEAIEPWATRRTK